MFTAKNLLRTSGVTDFRIARSVRLRSSAGGYFNRTPTSTSNRDTWTWSGWVKLGTLTSNVNWLFLAGSQGVTDTGFYFYNPNNTLQFLNRVGSTINGYIITTAVFRDPSAWYHVVAVYDSTNATATDRMQLYVNGVRQAVTVSTQLSSGADSSVNNNVAHFIGAIEASGTSANNFDGYMTEINFIDGQALTPTSFGAFDAITGVWNPKAYSGTYGTNGFKLNFSDNSGATATTIGKDSSGNGNNWTPNNISVTAGATYDSMVDSPTSYGTDTGVGGEVRGDYCTFNPLNATDTTFSNGNLRMVTASPGYGRPHLSTFGISSGQKFYAEFVVTSIGASSDVTIGIDDGSIVPAYYSNSGSTSGLPANFRGYRNGGGTYVGSTYTSGSPSISYTNGDKISVAVDRSANQITYYKNGSSVYTQSIASSVDQYYLCVMTFTGSADLTLNAGQTAFSYTAPSGFKALCTQNLPASTVTNGAPYMASTLYTGTGANLTVNNTNNGFSFQPDFVWLKSRSGARVHGLFDSVRGISRALVSTNTNAEDLDATNGVQAFNSNGFSVGSVATWNASGENYVGWNWKAGGTAVTNNNGSVSSQVSANPTAGFSILTYTGTGATATIGHGLGVAPSMMIMKKRSAAGGWKVYHTVLGNTQIVELNDTGGAQTSSTYWNNTSPTSTLVTVGSNADINASSETYVSYCWTAISGYSAFGSYIGNGSTDGPFVYCGFRPQFVLMKIISSATHWVIIDSSRDPYNVASSRQSPNLALSDATLSDPTCDFLSNGFKARTTTATSNQSGSTYIYAAFAENPFKYSRAR